jgi:hypothetical protein
MNKEIKKGKLNYDQSGRAYPDNPRIKKNWDCIWENDGKHYKLVGDNEHKEWEEIENQQKVMSKEQIIGKEFNLDLGSLAPVSMIVKDVTKDKVIVEYLNSTPGRTEEFTISDFEYFAMIKLESYE